MRRLNRGEILLKEELQEIANHYFITPHAMKRMNERGLNKEDVTKIILNPLLAYFNTDGTINIARNEDHYLVVGYNNYYKKY